MLTTAPSSKLSSTHLHWRPLITKKGGSRALTSMMSGHFTPGKGPANVVHPTFHNLHVEIDLATLTVISVGCDNGEIMSSTTLAPRQAPEGVAEGLSSTRIDVMAGRSMLQYWLVRHIDP